MANSIAIFESFMMIEHDTDGKGRTEWDRQRWSMLLLSLVWQPKIPLSLSIESCLASNFLLCAVRASYKSK